MKKITLIILLGFFSVTGYSKDITIYVKGMVCDFCSQGIHKKFSAHPNIVDVQVNLGNKQVKIKTKADLDLSDDEIKKMISESGFNVTEITRE
jgi:mercuric ion binding protein